MIQHLKSGFKRIINWNKYQSNSELLRKNQQLELLIGPSFLGINRVFILSFENAVQKISKKRYYLPNVEIKDYVMIDEKNFF